MNDEIFPVCQPSNPANLNCTKATFMPNENVLKGLNLGRTGVEKLTKI